MRMAAMTDAARSRARPSRTLRAAAGPMPGCATRDKRGASSLDRARRRPPRGACGPKGQPTFSLAVAFCSAPESSFQVKVNSPLSDALKKKD